MKPSNDNFELECKSKQYYDCYDSDSDDEVIDNQNESSSCDDLLPPNNHINNSLTSDCNSLVSFTHVIALVLPTRWQIHFICVIYCADITCFVC